MKTKSSIILLTILSLLQFSFSSGSLLRKTFVRNAAQRYAVCNDFSPAAYYIRIGSASKWIIHLEGGQSCYSASDCNNRYKTDINKVVMSSLGLPESAEGRDLLSTNPRDNPTFHDFSHVLIPFCSSDSWLGQGYHEAFSANGSFAFHDNKTVNDFVFRGATIFRSVIEDLHASGLSQAKEVVLCGSSAGGVGAVNHIRWLETELTNATVSVIADSAWSIDFEGNLASRFQFGVAALLWNYQQLSACRDVSRGYPCCVSLKCMLESSENGYPTDVPLFLVNSLYDIIVILLSTRRVYGADDVKMGDYARTSVVYGGAVNESLEKALLIPSVSYFLTGCSQNVYFATSSLWDDDDVYNISTSHEYTATGIASFKQTIKSNTWTSVTINDTSLRQAVHDWYRENFTTKQRHQDNCGGILCNPSCPDTLEFTMFSNRWQKALESFVVSIALLLTIFCVLAKITMLICQQVLIRKYVNFNGRILQLDEKEQYIPVCPEEEQMNISCLALQYYPPKERGLKLRRPSLRRTEPVQNEGKSDRCILSGVTAYFNPGEIIAVMGPSGSGKTTFLDLLTDRKWEGIHQGKVLINGNLREEVIDNFSYSTGYVLQLASPFYEELTVAQNLLYAAILYLSRTMTWEEQFTRIHQVLAETGLSELADRKVGGATGGLSGGQKRRLCVAIQLLNLPNIVFLDEPTSGLDASSSLELLRALHCLALSGRCVILTIHQPRMEIFHMFDRILLLSNGQIAYFGSPFDAPNFFREALKESGVALPAENNPADFIMDMLTNRKAQACVLDYYKASGEADAISIAVEEQEKGSTTLKEKNNPGIVYRVFALECRASSRQTMSLRLYLPLITLFQALILGTVYLKSSSNLMILAAMCVSTCSGVMFVSPVVMGLLSRSLNIFTLEKQDGVSFSIDVVLHTFIRVSAVSVIPFAVSFTIVYLSVLQEYNFSDFSMILLIQSSVSNAWIAILIFAIGFSPTMAGSVCPSLAALGTFFGGFLIVPSEIPSYYQWVLLINPTYWGYSASARILLEKDLVECPYKSAFECFPSSGLALLNEFGLEETNVYVSLASLFGLTVVPLILVVFVLHVRYTPQFWERLIESLSQKIKSKRTPEEPTKTRRDSVSAPVHRISAVAQDPVLPATVQSSDSFKKVRHHTVRRRSCWCEEKPMKEVDSEEANVINRLATISEESLGRLQRVHNRRESSRILDIRKGMMKKILASLSDESLTDLLT